MECPAFRHEPLQPGHIRLLGIIPSTKEDNNDAIFCYVDHISLSELTATTPPIRSANEADEDGHPEAMMSGGIGPFAALSYTWGPDVPTKKIVIISDDDGVNENDNVEDGGDDETGEEGLTIKFRILEIRENLWHFLKQLRAHRCKEFLWADAICIDQNNMEEKNEQVAMMGSIFSSAVNVYVWLGLEANSSSLLMEARLLTKLWGPKTMLMGIEKLLSASEQVPMWEVMLAFLKRPYWRRAWVVQEIGLAQGDIYVLCGESVVGYRKLCAMIDLLQMESKHVDPEVMPWKRKENEVARAKLATMLRELAKFRAPAVRSNRNTKKDFPDFLLRYADTDCYDPRDKVFAFLGLARVFSEVDPIFRVDYAKSAIEVFFDVLMLYKEPRHNPWGISMPRFGKQLMKSMSLSLEDIQEYVLSLDVKEGLNTTQPGNSHVDSLRVAAMFKLQGGVSNIASIVPQVSDYFLPDDWVLFEIPKIDKFYPYERTFRGLATKQIQARDSVLLAVDSDVAFIGRRVNGMNEIRSLAVVKPDSTWIPSQADFDRVVALHKKCGKTGPFEAPSEHSDATVLSIEPRFIVRVNLHIAVALIQGADALPESYDDEAPRRSTLSGSPNWRGYKWPVVYYWLCRMQRRFSAVVRYLEKVWWKFRYGYLGLRGSDSAASTRRLYGADDSTGYSPPPTPPLPPPSSETAYTRSQKPLIDDSVRAIADVWARAAESRRL